VALSEAENIATVIVPSDQMSLAIGKEGQNARLAYKLTNWRIDIKDPESLKDEDLEMLRQARADYQGEAGGVLPWQGRQPRLVRADGMVAVREQEFGPLPDDLIGMSVDVDIVGEVLEVYYNRALRARFDVTSGDLLPLDE
jgi:transcription termination/antitermination protein NusA